MEKVNRQSKVLAAFLISAVGLGGGLLVWDRVSGDKQPVPIETVDALSPEQALLNDALRINAARNDVGVRPFPYLPKSRPADLTHLVIGGNGDAVVDSYKLKSGDFSVYVAFSVKPTTLCQNIRTGQVPGLCVRDQAVNLPPADGYLYHHIIVYFTSRNGGPLDMTNPDIAVSRKYWYNVELVPADDAVWFTDLVARARAATVK